MSRVRARALGICAVLGLFYVPELLPPKAAAVPPTEIDYQGRITIGRQAFTGTALFKFAITDLAGTTNRWANDGTPTGEPAGACSLAVSEGRFSTLLGGAPMQPLDPAALDAPEAVYLRVWFSRDATNYSELTPKQRLVSSPYAIDSLRLEGKSGAFFQDAANLASGTIPDARLGSSVTRLGPTIGAGEIENGAVGSEQIADGSVRVQDLVLTEIDARYVHVDENGVQAPLRIANTLTVAGAARFENGISFVAPAGDLSMGSFTNRP
jgi:hypothetical protein